MVVTIGTDPKASPGELTTALTPSLGPWPPVPTQHLPAAQWSREVDSMAGLAGPCFWGGPASCLGKDGGLATAGQKCCLRWGDR